MIRYKTITKRYIIPCTAEYYIELGVAGTNNKSVVYIKIQDKDIIKYRSINAICTDNYRFSQCIGKIERGNKLIIIAKSLHKSCAKLNVHINGVRTANYTRQFILGDNI